MRKIVIPRPGGYQRLTLQTQPDPLPLAGEVLVRVEACGVNFADVIIRQGFYKSAKQYVGWPITPGFEFSGTVAAVGAGVSRWREGEQVMGVTRFGAYASHVAVPEHQLVHLPAKLTLVEAAGFPTVFLTAYHAVFDHVVLRPRSTVLVHSAAGGVGSALLQLLKIADCRVVGVVGATHKVAVAERLGADVVIDKSREALWSAAERIAPAGYDAIFDGNGPDTLKESFAHLAPVGKLVSYGFHSMFDRRGGRPNYGRLFWQWLRIPRFSPLTMTDQNKGVVAFNLSFLFDRADLLAASMAQLLAWVDEGRLVPPPVRTFPFDEVAQAHRALESGTTTGKLVLVDC